MRFPHCVSFSLYLHWLIQLELTSGSNSWMSWVWIVNNSRMQKTTMTRRSWVRISMVSTVYNLRNSIKAILLFHSLIQSCHALMISCICWKIIKNKHNNVLGGTRFKPTTLGCSHLWIVNIGGYVTRLFETIPNSLLPLVLNKAKLVWNSLTVHYLKLRPLQCHNLI